MQRVTNERVLVQIGLLIVAVALFASTFGQQFSSADLAQSPMFFPRVILILWMGLGLIALLQSIRSDERTTKIDSWPRMAVVLVAALIYTNVVASEGFFLPSVGFAIVCLLAFGIRRPWLLILFALLVPGALVVLFNHTLGMPLPTSRFTYLF
ncbi:hypothetical protein ACMU_13205 [Actibacterium mucosum KCTC 23349]|uniref:DUF1468 domain-containing protein n=1 Tax=Actibacterium mucosum KCTC 23349 TaxID=1454373 RepID=A0A037ZHM5_9RHOB|nr:tripartite tricarboxylate transporter TctB family protein [Actibacterium mucosum]KAJ55643.1 hypothetical protein ACMU_13205 [Actibacterium mucosum KCTC 23349]